MKKIAALIFLLVCSIMATSQVNPTQIRTATSLPATCVSGSDGKHPMDMLGVGNAGVTSLQVCAQTNTWQNLGASAVLTPSTDETFQPLNPTTAIHFKCPVGADANFVGYDFQAADGSNIVSMNCGKTVTFADGISGHWLAQYFGSSTGVIAQGGLIRCSNTQTCMAWRNAAGTADITVAADNTDTINITNATHVKIGTAYVPQMTGLSAAKAIIASGTDTGFASSGVIYADDPSFAVGAGTDFCKILNNAEHAGVTLKQDIDARGLFTGTDMSCLTNPTDDNYTGTVYLPVGRIFLQSNAAIFMSHSRVHYKGARESRTANGPTAGTDIIACNEAGGAAFHSAACNGTTFDPVAGGVCKDGAAATVPCALFTWSLNANPGLPVTQMFASTLEDVTISCNSVSGCIGIQGGMYPISGSCVGKCGPQENSWVKGVRIEDWGNAGTAVKLMPGTSNFQMDSLNVLNEGVVIADCSAAHAFNVFFDNAAPPANGPKQISNWTNTNGGCVINPASAMLLDAGQVRVQGAHCENLTDSCIYVGSQADAKGYNLMNINGVTSGSGTSVIHLESGHTIAGTATSIVNVNVAGYTILDDVHGTGIRIDCQSTTGIYSFGSGITDTILTDAPCMPKVFTTGPPYITNVALTAGDVVREVAGSTSYQITKNNWSTNLIQEPVGITLATISDTAVRVPVATHGIVGVGGIAGPIVDTGGACLEGDWVYPGSTTNGKVVCSTNRPYNIGILGRALNTANAGDTLPMMVRPEPPLQPIQGCTATNGNPVGCATAGTSRNVGAISCANATSAGTCTVNTNAVKTASIIQITRTSSLSGSCDVAMVETASSNVPVSAIVDATSFTVNVPTLTAAKQFCFFYQIINP